VFGWHALRYTPLTHWWPFELFDIFGLLLFAPLPLLLLLSMLCASRTAGLWLMAPVLLLSWEYGGLMLPQVQTAEGRPLRVMTANLLVSNGERARVAAGIIAEDADIVALQELGTGMSEYLARELKTAYPHQLLGPSDAPDGLGILSRYPIRTEPETGWYGHVCQCQRVRIDLGSEQLVFINVHPPPPAIGLGRLGRLPMPTGFDPRQTNEPLDAALDGVDLQYTPTVVAGDFNVSDRQPKYRELRRHLNDAFREAGWGLGYSFPSRTFERFPDLSIIRIDYILHDRSMTATAARTGVTPGSDHRHVIADLRLR
jgi:endonuclease/exonuclease/phosphatase (EEP) superfamily protein YafD